MEDGKHEFIIMEKAVNLLYPPIIQGLRNSFGNRPFLCDSVLLGLWNHKEASLYEGDNQKPIFSCLL